MITRRLVRTRQLKEGMKIDQSVVDRAGRNLVQKGSILDNYVIESLLRMGIMMVYIQTGEESDDDIEKSISPQARKQIERLRTDDRSKVELSNSVKTRVAEGIQYIYANAGSDQLADTTNNIASNLMTAINDNDAIAIDINALKTSDEYTFKHSVDVATMSMILAKQQGLSQKQIYEIGVAGLLHDIGKTKIPLEILNKPGKLTDDELKTLKSIIRKSNTSKTIRSRCQIIIDLDEAHGKVLTHEQSARSNGVCLTTVTNTVTKYFSGGIEAVTEFKRNINSDNARRILDGRAEARIIELACGPVPEGHSRWTLRLLEKEAKVVLDTPVSKDAIRRALKKQTSTSQK